MRVWPVACQGPGFYLEQVTRGEQGGHLHARARGRPVNIDDAVAGRTDREKFRGVGNEEEKISITTSPKLAPAAAGQRRRSSKTCRAWTAGSRTV